MKPATFELTHIDGDQWELCFCGDWLVTNTDKTPSESLLAAISKSTARQLQFTLSHDSQWDSLLISTLLKCHNFCRQNIKTDYSLLPGGIVQLLTLASTVPAKESSHQHRLVFDPIGYLKRIIAEFVDFMSFVGECTLAIGKLLIGKANYRSVDLREFLYLAGPQALAIITLLSFLVGMILAYLGAVQLSQFGAQVYVANLVAIGMVREMGALMTAVIMSGRTGAAYAAQLGSMQVNEEIDAIKTIGISPVEFLVLPRMVALIVIMPLLCIYADFMGILGGSVVALGMDVSFLQYIENTRNSLHLHQILTGVFKALVFGCLIAIAGCRAGMSCGRSSAEVGQAATNAVVTAIVYLVVSDALLNIIFTKLGI